MKKMNKTFYFFVLSLLITSSINAQNIPTLEMTRGGLPTNFDFGTGILPMTVTLKNDALNNNNFSTNTPAVTCTISLENQVFTGLNYGCNNTPDGGGGFINTLQTTGLVFGAGPSLATDPFCFGATAYNRYNVMGEYGGNGGPKDNMFTSNPKATGAQLGTGIQVSNGTNGNTNGNNGGFEVFTTAQALFGSGNGVGSRVYFGELVLTYNQPVVNPVVHVAGLGGSYRYLPLGLPDIPSNYLSTYFTTELELQTPGVTTSLLSGNSFIQLTGDNKIINSNHANPNGGSVLDPLETFNNLGAATGSIKVTGAVVTELRFKVYLQSGTSSQFAWSVPGSLINGATRDPFTGDIWYVATSIDKPTQQLSGNVFLDKDGLNDAGGGDINKSAGVANPKTIADGTMFANLISGGLIIARVPIDPTGSYLFDNIAPGVYSVQLSTGGAVGSAPVASVLPAGWVNTGEHVGANPGSDGSVNGIQDITVTVLASDIKTEVNFGIEKVPNSQDYNTLIAKPRVGDFITLNNSAPLNLPILQGSDPEDKPIQGVLTGNTVRITTLPTNSTLIYNGVNVTAGQTIPNFNPALLVIQITSATQGTSATQFNYAYVDAAGVPDPTPATYRIFWTAGPLANTFTKLSGVYSNGVSALSWTSLSETNFSHYDVEFGVNGNDFASIGKVNGIGAANTKTDYAYNHKQPVAGVNYYRLKLFNKDGSFTYSNVVALNVIVKGITITNVYPNPFTDKVTVSIASEKVDVASVRIFDNAGKLVYNQTNKIPAGTSLINLTNLSKLANGSYMIEVRMGDVVLTKQLIK